MSLKRLLPCKLTLLTVLLLSAPLRPSAQLTSECNLTEPEGQIYGLVTGGCYNTTATACTAFGATCCTKPCGASTVTATVQQNLGTYQVLVSNTVGFDTRGYKCKTCAAKIGWLCGVFFTLTHYWNRQEDVAYGGSCYLSSSVRFMPAVAMVMK